MPRSRRPPSEGRDRPEKRITADQATRLMHVAPGTTCQHCDKPSVKAWPWPDGSFALPLCGDHWPARGHKGTHVDPIEAFYRGGASTKTTERREGREDW